MKKITIELPFTEGERVIVKNYRTRDKYEEVGVIKVVKVAIDHNGDYFISYDVMLDRRKKDGRVFWLYVGPKDVRSYSNDI